MLQHSNYKDPIKFLIGSFQCLSEFQSRPPLEIFSSIVLDFWAKVSGHLLAQPLIKDHPDVVSFAFYCRRANIVSLSKYYERSDYRCGRGVIFHIAPSNIPVNFAYSLIVGMLAGNSNIVRLSNKDFTQVSLICEAINDVLSYPEFVSLRERICIIRYPRSFDINQFLSNIADVRMIWGGDNTISEIRQASLGPRANDICFSNRYSIALLNAAAVLDTNEIDSLALKFFNDTYLFDQNACSAPRLIVWFGEASDIEVAQKKFWNAIQGRLNDYHIDPVSVVDKLTTLCLHANDSNGIHLHPKSNNKLWRLSIEHLNTDLTDHQCAAGYFLEYSTLNLMDLQQAINRKYQTLAYFGFSSSEMTELIMRGKFLGVDRVVPVGRTTDFSLIWDGHDLISSLSRRVTIF